MKDTLVIGGHEFQSRFILGSGKYSLCAVQTMEDWQTSSTIFRRA